MIDTATLSLAIGLGNLAFAVLVTVYTGSIRITHEPLSTWRWARLIGSIAFFLIWLRPAIPLWLSLTASHLLLIAAWALEYAAYANLLGRRDWRKPLMLLTGSALILQLILHGAGVARRVDLIYFSLVNSGFFIAMAVLLLTERRSGLLVRLMGVTNGIGGLLFLGRVIPLLYLDDLTHPDYQALHIALFVAGYLIIVINGYGFLLLAKQQDDRALREALADVAQAEAEQRQLLSLAAHEFRTPAAMIRASLDSLKFLADDTPPAVALRLDNMRQATQRLIHLANALITQDRLRELRFGLVLQEVDIQTVVGQTVERYATPIVWRGLDQPQRITVDAELLTIALHNLIDNALRHSTADQPPEVGLRITNNALEIRVVDCGAGVPDPEKEAIFERFYRRDAGPGSGLGLSIVRAIARLHGGEATVRDRVPQGAVFVIRLPLVEQTAAKSLTAQVGCGGQPGNRR